MKLSSLPDYLVLRGVRPGGIRLPKREKALFYGPTTCSSYQPSTLFKPYGGKVADTLSSGDFRYWIGMESFDTYACCRSCAEVVVFAADRKAHMKAGCGTILTNAYKLLLRRPARCVICDKETTQSAWGVPLCSKDCREDWCWTDGRPDALVAAIELIERAK